LEKILPDMIDSLEVVGSGIGALRKIKLKNGGNITERLDAAYDDRLFAYTITFNDVMPFDNYCAVVTLEHAGDKTAARWGSNWDVKGASEDEVKTMLNGLYGTLLEGLQKLVTAR
jgi:polyketide cyclase/dehydrase/lipid transport protein